MKGALAHIAGPIPGGWRVIDVWQSKAAFARFGKKLGPIMKIGGDGQRQAKDFSPHPVHQDVESPS